MGTTGYAKRMEESSTK
ncbi:MULTISPECIES: hypothetical protein [Burkholderia]